MEVDFTPLMEVAGTALLALLSVAVVWGRGKVIRLLNIREDSETRAYLDEALRNGIRAVNARMGDLIDQHGRVTISNQQTAAVVDYVVGQVPDAVNRFNLSRSQIEDMVAARVSQTVEMDRWQAGRIIEAAAEPTNSEPAS